MTSSTAQRPLTREIDTRTAARLVESEGAITLLSADGSPVTFTTVNRDDHAMIRFISADGSHARIVPWDYHDLPTLTQVVQVQVGDGMTLMVGSDRYAYTVQSVSPTGKTLKLTPDKYRRTDDNGMSENQTYAYESVAPYTERDEFTGEVGSNIAIARWSARRGRYLMDGFAMSHGRHAHLDPHL